MASDLVRELEFLVSLNEPDKGGPYGGFAAWKCIDAMRRAAALLSSQEAALMACRPIIERLIAAEHNVETWGLKQLLAAIDAALTPLPEGGQ